jgi:transposase-like protein
LKSTKPSRPRIPDTVDGIQVNFCKNVQCANYGTPASPLEQPHGPGAANRGRDKYTIDSREKYVPSLKCVLCGKKSVMKSNLAISEEAARYSQYLQPELPPSCPNENCTNSHSYMNVVDCPEEYIKYGETTIRSPRFKCRKCGKTFSIVKKSNHRQRKSHLNRFLFKLLMNKTPFRRICEVLEIYPATLYGKIDFIHRQCQAFVGNRERKLAEGKYIKRLEIGVDRQDYSVNWLEEKDKRNVILHAVGSADNITGYVFGMHLNYDETLMPNEVEDEAIRFDDYKEKKPLRRFARLWLKGDYDESVRGAPTRNLGRKDPSGALGIDIAGTYADIEKRKDTEVFESQDSSTQLPRFGMQVHAEYSLYGHFVHLRRLLPGAMDIVFLLDQESGIRAACLTAYCDEILRRRCDALYVRVNKEMTVPQKRQAIRAARNKFKAHWRANHSCLDWESALEFYFREEIKDSTKHGKWKDKWVHHPVPRMNEPEKAMCLLTDLGDHDEDALLELYMCAGLHAIDRFFMQVRRRICLLERPFGSANNKRRLWYGYSPYNPRVMQKLLDIFRVYYNYHLIGQDKQTPAMRLGLAKAPVPLEKILYYQKPSV